MTKQIIDPQFASNLHSSILTPIGLLAFSIHTFLAVRLALVRNGKWNAASLASLASIYLGFIVTFVYIGYFYQKPTNNIPETKTITENNPSQTLPAAESATIAEKTFALEELAKYDGKNGNPAYAAINGIVYDVSAVFESGTHFGHSAGQDLTNAFFSKHIERQITKYPATGKLIQ
jgi:predicted heme/steroid binding protein